MPKLVHAADLHLDSALRGLARYEGAPVERMVGATRRALENLVALAIAEQAAFVLLAGDVYDGDWKDYATGLFFAAQMARLRAAGIDVLVVNGNHDAASRISRSLPLPENVHVFASKAPSTRRLDAWNVAVHGQSFATQDVSDDLAARYPDPVPGALNIGILHTCLDGRAGHDPYAPCSVATLRSKGYDYWALGHVHAREVVASEPWIVYPGNVQGRHAREIGPKGATLVAWDGDGIGSVEHRDLDVVRWEIADVDASLAASVDDVAALARAALGEAAKRAGERTVAARVVVSGATRAHAALVRDADDVTNRIRAVANDVDADVWVEKVRLLTSPDADLEALAHRDDPLGHVVRALAGIRSDPSLRAALFESLADLAKTFPAELRDGEGGLRLEDDALQRELLEDVARTLVPALVERGGEP